MSFVNALKSEIAALEASLKANPDPRMIKMREAQRLLAIYQTDIVSPAKPEPERESKPKGRTPALGGRRASPEALKAVQAVERFLINRTAPTNISALESHVRGLGIKLSGKNPKATLSAHMYRSGRFKSFLRSGWILKEMHDPIARSSNHHENLDLVIARHHDARPSSAQAETQRGGAGSD